MHDHPSSDDPPPVAEELERLVQRVLQGQMQQGADHHRLIRYPYPRPTTTILASQTVLMQQGADHHRLGRLPQAEDAYRTVLREQPLHADANHNLGVIALGTGDFASALRHFATAREARPGNWQYWISHMDALLLSGDCWGAAEVLEDDDH